MTYIFYALLLILGCLFGCLSGFYFADGERAAAIFFILLSCALNIVAIRGLTA